MCGVEDGGVSWAKEKKAWEVVGGITTEVSLTVAQLKSKPCFHNFVRYVRLQAAEIQITGLPSARVVALPCSRPPITSYSLSRHPP